MKLIMIYAWKYVLACPITLRVLKPFDGQVYIADVLHIIA